MITGHSLVVEISGSNMLVKTKQAKLHVFSFFVSSRNTQFVLLGTRNGISSFLLLNID